MTRRRTPPAAGPRGSRRARRPSRGRRAPRLGRRAVDQRRRCRRRGAWRDRPRRRPAPTSARSRAGWARCSDSGRRSARAARPRRTPPPGSHAERAAPARRRRLRGSSGDAARQADDVTIRPAQFVLRRGGRAVFSRAADDPRPSGRFDNRPARLGTLARLRPLARSGDQHHRRTDMASALNAFMKIGKAKGESKQAPSTTGSSSRRGSGKSRPRPAGPRAAAPASASRAPER